MDNSIRVIDDFLDEKEIDVVEKELTEGSGLFEWFYFPSTVANDNEFSLGLDSPQLVHSFYSITKRQTAQMSPKFKLIECLLEKLEKHDIKNVMLIRAKANVLFPTNKNLKHSVPHFIKSNDQLMKKIVSIDIEAVENPSVGNFDIFLRKKR